MTITQKILAHHANVPAVSPGDLIVADVDWVLGNDITTPVAAAEFEKAGFTKVFDPEKVLVVLDHLTPCKDIKSAALCKTCRDFGEKMGIPRVFDVGEAGIEHAFLPEQGFIAPGELFIGADSHTCTGGALGAFAAGVGKHRHGGRHGDGEALVKGSRAIASSLPARRASLFRRWISFCISSGRSAVDGALLQIHGIYGRRVYHPFSMDDRFTIANMATEAGAKNGIFPVDDTAKEYIRG
jgi:3-isopropylmalate/(R)-2-methylmalate dehydratase large subunit